ncbi:FecR domain-containing protein [Aurantiacibacter sp. MUD61]|uniref:FecR domain-containing protein n=1 Tax=Aurantiacibacter sp. MUD61 TaxID=3009083 RepID=UPI0022F02DD0|nr:FecR domain-containing protein [Aurantiacibacter sp. MUD61]
MVKVLASKTGLAFGLAALCSVFAPTTLHAQDDSTIGYRMAAGDTLIGVSQEYVIGRDAAARLARLNRIQNPRRIPIGTVIRIPRDQLVYRPAGLAVLSSRGPVTIDGVEASQGAELREGAVVQTGPGGFVSFQTVDGAAISLPSNTLARLERSRIYLLRDLRDVHFRILSGRGEVIAPTLRDDERWQTSTPVSVTAVRGTVYRVGYSEEAELGLTEVVEGSVAVTADEAATVAQEGFGVVVVDEGLSPPEALLPPPEIENANAIQTGEAVAFEIALPEGAVALRTQLATDAGFLELFAEDISSEGAAFTDLPNGRYFIRSRGISANGLEGLSAPVAENFRRKRLGSEASVEASPIEDGYRFAWLPQGEGTTHFAFQLWREGESDAPLYDEIALPGSATVVTGLEPGTYVWRVAAIQADEEDGLLKIWGSEQRLAVSAE